MQFERSHHFYYYEWQVWGTPGRLAGSVVDAARAVIKDFMRTIADRVMDPEVQAAAQTDVSQEVLASHIGRSALPASIEVVNN